MKKMRIKNNDVVEIMNGFKFAAASAIEFIAMTIAIPARIILLAARGLHGVAEKLENSVIDTEPKTVEVEHVPDIIAEVADV